MSRASQVRKLGKRHKLLSHTTQVALRSYLPHGRVNENPTQDARGYEREIFGRKFEGNLRRPGHDPDTRHAAEPPDEGQVAADHAVALKKKKGLVSCHPQKKTWKGLRSMHRRYGTYHVGSICTYCARPK